VCKPWSSSTILDGVGGDHGPESVVSAEAAASGLAIWPLAVVIADWISRAGEKTAGALAAAGFLAFCGVFSIGWAGRLAAKACNV
jgi:hypothetical protein